MSESVQSSPIAVLPLDCWQLILNLLSWDELVSMSLTSRRLRVLTEPILYRAISWNWNPVPLRRILRLLRTVFQRPQLAAYIQHISLLSNDNPYLDEPWKEPSCEMDNSDETFLEVVYDAQNTVTETGFPQADEWNSALQDRNPYAFTAILLSQLHNLQSLKLDYSFVWKSGFPGLMLKHALGYEGPQLSKFRFLREVDYGANVRMACLWTSVYEAVREEGYPACEPQQFPAWFYLPALRSLAVWLRTKEDLFVMPGQPNVSQLHTLILVRSTIREEQVPEILSAATTLQTLHLGLAYRKPGMQGGLPAETPFENGAAILQGLGYMKDNLSHLSLGWEYYPPLEYLMMLEPGHEELTNQFHGFLNNFRNLETAEIPLTLLLGWDPKTTLDLVTALPTTLRRLCLRGDPSTPWENAWYPSATGSLVAKRVVDLRSRMPALEEVVAHHWTLMKDKREKTKKVHKELKSICVQQGINLSFVVDNLSAGLWTHPSHSGPERITE